MVFSSLFFIFVFLAVTLAVYYILPKKLHNLWLFIVSMFFYAFGEPKYVALMAVSIVVNFFFGIIIEKSSGRKSKKTALILNVIFNLSLLGFFKYASLAVDSLKVIPALSGLKTPDIPLPIGISFYTFQTMSYTIDVYRGKCPAQRNLINFGAYVSLFPQLIAGPIVRYVDVEKQLKSRTVNLDLFEKGAKLFILGLSKKVLLANQLGVLWDALREDPESGILGSWVGICAFSLEIYFDFSGYSDMARGLGLFFGFEFVKNFDYPYISRSETEFWRRWHISLGSWFREYVYIPLGGNRKGTARMCLNLAVTWILTGLWHGASWNFVLWGAYYALILTIEKLLLLKPLSRAPAVVGRLYGGFLTTLGWVIFSFEDISEMRNYFVRLFSLKRGILGSDAKFYVASFLPLFLFSVLASTPVIRKIYDKIDKTRIAPIAEFLAALSALVLSTASLVSSDYNPFLYFRF